MRELRGEVRVAASICRERTGARGRRGGRSTRLESVVRKEILPRLLQVHARGLTLEARPAILVEALARALVEEDEAASCDALARLASACGDDLSLLTEGLAPAARRLGDWWSQDSCDFFLVSQAVARLQAFMTRLAAPGAEGALAPAMLMLTPPGETHRFGAEMAADLFRREGWRVERADGDLEPLRRKAFDAVAVSCGCESAAEALPKFIQDIRARTRRSRLPILLGGALFIGRPERGENLDADFVASDPDLFKRISRVLLKPRGA